MTSDQPKPVTVDEIRASGWEKIVADCKVKDCQHYSHLFFDASAEAGKAGEARMVGALRLLGHATSMALRSSDTIEPLRAYSSGPEGRSAIASDFNEDELDVMAGVVVEIGDPELQARIADLLWLRRRKYEMAKLAIQDYLTSAEKFEDPREWRYSFNKIERALRLAIQLGPKAGQMERVVTYIKDILAKPTAVDSQHLSNKLMGLLAQRRIGDPKTYSSLAEQLALRAEAANDWWGARSFWERKAEWDELGKDDDGRRMALTKAAETYVKLADASIEGAVGGHMAAASHLERAIEAYRRMGGKKERVDELHRRMLEHQKKSLKELSPVSTSIDIDKLKEAAKDLVRGKPFVDSLFELSLKLMPARVEDLRREIQETAREAPLTFLMSGARINSSGKIVGKKKGLLADTKEEQEDAMLSHMYSAAADGHSFYARSLIEPIRSQILDEHNCSRDDFGPITKNNPLIPEGREDIYKQGLMAGLNGDFLVAIHLLVPQIENSIRHLLSQHGVITSALTADGIQPEYDLNTTLYMDETKKILGADLTFELQGLLTESEGSNLRNRMAHGLMDHGDFYSGSSHYFWAMVIRLCCLPSIVRKYEKERKRDNATEAGELPEIDL